MHHWPHCRRASYSEGPCEYLHRRSSAVPPVRARRAPGRESRGPPRLRPGDVRPARVIQHAGLAPAAGRAIAVPGTAGGAGEYTRPARPSTIMRGAEKKIHRPAARPASGRQRSNATRSSRSISSTHAKDPSASWIPQRSKFETSNWSAASLRFRGLLLYSGSEDSSSRLCTPARRDSGHSAWFTSICL